MGLLLLILLIIFFVKNIILLENLKKNPFKGDLGMAKVN